ncbi:hypothetical protein ACOKW7_17170 [Limnospira platensis CENA597]
MQFKDPITVVQLTWCHGQGLPPLEGRTLEMGDRHFRLKLF